MPNYTPLCSLVIRTPPRRSRIQIVREAAGLSKKDLAKRAGVSPTTVYAFEDGYLDVRISTILKIANALGVPSETLLPGELVNQHLKANSGAGTVSTLSSRGCWLFVQQPDGKCP